MNKEKFTGSDPINALSTKITRMEERLQQNFNTWATRIMTYILYQDASEFNSKEEYGNNYVTSLEIDTRRYIINLTK